MVVPDMQDLPGWDDITDPWTPDEYVHAFRKVATTYVDTKWSRTGYYMAGTDIEELRSIALEELVHASRAWPAWAAAHDGGEHSRRKFWAYAKQRIFRTLQDHHKQLTGRTPHQVDLKRRVRMAFSVDLEQDRESRDQILTPHFQAQQVRSHTEPSTSHWQLVDTVRTLTRPQQIVVALTVIDGRTQVEAAKLMTLGIGPLRAHWIAAATTIRTALRNQHTEDQQPMTHALNHTPYADSGALIRYIRTTHGCSVEEYLSRALDAYRGDVELALALMHAVNMTLDTTRGKKVTDDEE